MKTRETTPGRTYSVHTSSVCTVSDKNGWSKTIDAPDGYFTAHAGEVTIDGDDEADVREVFKLAPYQKLRLLGVVGGGVPAWFAPLKAELTALLDGSQFELAWLAGEKTLVVHTDRVADDLLERVRTTVEAYLPAGVELVQYNHNMEISWRNINKYAKCVTVADVQAVNPDYKNDLTADGEWLYHLDSLETATDMFRRTKIKIFRCRTPKVKTVHAMFHSCTSLEIIDADLSSSTNIYDFCCNCTKLSVCTSEFPNIGISHFMAFFNTKLDKKSAIRIINSLPPINGTLYIGIHIDYQNDETVLAAIANAKAKRWTLKVQWNGTPTSTASTLSFGSLIYAKVGEVERPDGTTEQFLDWGHYVTDPTGYETFRSLESAYRYFELPMPEDLTNN